MHTSAGAVLQIQAGLTGQTLNAALLDEQGFAQLTGVGNAHTDADGLQALVDQGSDKAWNLDIFWCQRVDLIQG